MAKIERPLFGDSASGKIAKWMTFSSWKGKPYLKRSPIKKLTDSILKRQWWRKMDQCQKRWSIMSAADRFGWEQLFGFCYYNVWGYCYPYQSAFHYHQSCCMTDVVSPLNEIILEGFSSWVKGTFLSTWLSQSLGVKLIARNLSECEYRPIMRRVENSEFSETLETPEYQDWELWADTDGNIAEIEGIWLNLDSGRADVSQWFYRLYTNEQCWPKFIQNETIWRVVIGLRLLWSDPGCFFSLICKTGLKAIELMFNLDGIRSPGGFQYYACNLYGGWYGWFLYGYGQHFYLGVNDVVVWDGEGDPLEDTEEKELAFGIETDGVGRIVADVGSVEASPGKMFQKEGLWISQPIWLGVTYAYVEEVEYEVDVPEGCEFHLYMRAMQYGTGDLEMRQWTLLDGSPEQLIPQGDWIQFMAWFFPDETRKLTPELNKIIVRY